jgi:hypothetical protein
MAVYEQMFRQPLVMTASNTCANWPNRRFFFQEKVLANWTDDFANCFSKRLGGAAQ